MVQHPNPYSHLPGFLATFPAPDCPPPHPDCIFCRIVTGDEPARVLRRWSDCIVFEPLDPVTSGHVLVVPRAHLTHALESPWQTGNVFMRAAQFARDSCGDLDAFNLITSVGEAATQTVEHLHVHVVPRVEGDGLCLPWTHQHRGQFGKD